MNGKNEKRVIACESAVPLSPFEYALALVLVFSREVAALS